jgi:C1A family cysteine protease
MKRKATYLMGMLVLMSLLTANTLLAPQEAKQKIPQRCPLNPEYVHPSASKYGLIPYSMDLSYLEKERGIIALEALPAAWDWRYRNGTTPAKDQSHCPVCWAFAATGVLESKTLIHSGLAYDLSEENVKECNDWLRGCYGGTIFTATSYFTRHGAVLEASNPYNPDTTGYCNSSVPRVVQVSGWRLVGSSDVAAIKNAVYQYGPCYTSMYASFPGFVNYDGSYVLYYTGNESPDHAVMIVGWDDNLRHAGGSGAWICKNSWGADWGDNGFFYIAYGSARVGQISSFYDLYKYYDYLETLYLYDEGGWIDSYGYPSSKTAWGLVKFTATKDDCIQAVDFWVNVFHLDYQIFIYGNFDGNNVSNLLHTQSGTITTGAGYYSIPLTLPVWIKKENNFIVVVKFTTTGYSYPVPTDSTDTYYPIENGKCYMSPDGSPDSWVDMGVSRGRDIGIRARTKNHVPVFHGHDFNGNGRSDLAVWRPGNRTWYIKDVAVQNWGISGDIPVNGDYNGNGVTDVSVWRPYNGVWYVKNIGSYQWGAPGDVPVPGDYNGDQTTDIAVWRPSNGTWYIRNIGAYQWGTAGDIPVPGDYDGDGATDIAVWRPGNGTWHIRNIGSFKWGALGDIPVPGDYDGDGATEMAVWRPAYGMWHIKDLGSFQWGAAGDVPVPGDYNGDRIVEVAVWRPANGMWHIKDLGSFQWGAAGDLPLVR